MYRMAGRRVKPGEYTIRLTAGGQVLSTQVKVLQDPRIEAPAEDFDRQDTMLASIENDVADINRRATQIRNLRSQLAGTLEKTSDPEIVAVGHALDSKLAAMENLIVATAPVEGQRFVTEPPRLVDVFKFQHTNVNQVQPEITDGDRAVFGEISKQWAIDKAQIVMLVGTQLDTLNRLLLGKKLPAINPLPDSGS